MTRKADMLYAQVAAMSDAEPRNALENRQLCGNCYGVRGVCMNQIRGPPSGARCSSTIWKPRDS